MCRFVARLCHKSNTNKHKSYRAKFPLCYIGRMKRQSTFNFRLPKELKGRLDKFCNERGISKADLAVTAIAEFLDTIEQLDRAHLLSRVYPAPRQPEAKIAEEPPASPPRIGFHAKKSNNGPSASLKQTGNRAT
jgi:predicted DNA-binding protein